MWSQFHTWISNRDNVTFLIAIAGFALSIWNFVENILKSRKKLSFHIFSVDTYKDLMVVTMAIENLSQLPIAITNIKYVSGNRKTSCTPIPKLVCEATKRCGNVVTDQRSTYSEKIPIQIPSLGAFSGVILFEHLPEELKSRPTSLTFEISTNRGKAFQKTVELTEESLYHQRLS